VAERMVEANGVEFCTESFGDPADQPILLIMGVGGSMLWWEEGFCRLLAQGGRFVIRYDHRDTGRSVTYEPGRPEYTGADLVADAAGLLDAYGIPAAHVVGVSAGGAFAQLLALGFPARVLSLVVISTSPATPGERRLPSATERYRRFLASATVDWSDEESVIEHLVAYARVLGGERPFGEAVVRKLVRRDVERAHNIAASENHGTVPEGEVSREPLSSVAVPTLVIHGTADPDVPARAWAGPRPGRFRARGCSPWREPVTESSEPIGKPSRTRSSRTPPRARRFATHGRLAAREAGSAFAWPLQRRRSNSRRSHR
jgi:pimeloyl-ACP methyl ester carboxylesterase